MATQRICDAMLPALSNIFQTSVAQAAQVIWVFAVVYGLAQLFYGPLGDRTGQPSRVLPSKRSRSQRSRIGWAALAPAHSSSTSRSGGANRPGTRIPWPNTCSGNGRLALIRKAGQETA